MQPCVEVTVPPDQTDALPQEIRGFDGVPRDPLLSYWTTLSLPSATSPSRVGWWTVGVGRSRCSRTRRSSSRSPEEGQIRRRARTSEHLFGLGPPTFRDTLWLPEPQRQGQCGAE